MLDYEHRKIPVYHGVSVKFCPVVFWMWKFLREELAIVKITFLTHCSKDGMRTGKGNVLCSSLCLIGGREDGNA